MKLKSSIQIVVLGTLITSAGASAQDTHLNAGSFGTSQDAYLIFDNGPVFDTDSGYVKTLTYTNGGTFAGYYQGNLTLTVLAATGANFGPVSNAPALGSHIAVRLVSLEGPAGGTMGFWETNTTQPTFTIATGQTGTNGWTLSSNDGSPGSDPYGHIHGRRYTFNVPGIYTVGFQLFDISTNGVGGGPIHTPSDIHLMHFQAGINVASIEPDIDHTHVRFAAVAGMTWQVEATESFNPSAVWTAVGDPVTGNDHLRQVDDHYPVIGERYYRIRSVAQ